MFSESERGVQKLVSISVTSMSMTRTREKEVETTKMAESTGVGKDRKKSKGKYLENLAQVHCIRYPINFGKKPVLALLDSGSKVNAIYPAFVKELGLPIRLTDVGAQKLMALCLTSMEW